MPEVDKGDKLVLVEVDMDNLDKEWSKQDGRVNRICERIAEAKYDHATAKAKFDLVAAELELSIRTSPEEYNLPKVTDKVIEASVIVQKEYKVAEKATIIAKYRVDILEGALKTLEHRKKALEDYVSMSIAGFFGQPKAKKGEHEEINEQRKKSVRRPLDKKKRRSDDD